MLQWQLGGIMKNEDYVTKILEHVGPIIDVVGLFLVVKKIQEDEREACASLADECVDIEKLGNVIRKRKVA